MSDLDAILKTTQSVVGLAAPFLPGIIQLFQGLNPIPPDATPAVKTDINNAKAAGANDAAMVIINQWATSGKIPVSANDPTVRAAIAGALEQEYQRMKTDGTLTAPADGTVTVTAGAAPAWSGSKIVITGTIQEAK